MIRFVIGSLCGSDVYSINELARAARELGKATALTYASFSHPWKSLASKVRPIMTAERRLSLDGRT